MICLHPHCPMGHGAANWDLIVASPEAKVRPSDRLNLIIALSGCGPLGENIETIPTEIANSAPFKRILDLCPCLYAQVPDVASARGVVHLCEVTLGQRIDSNNVYDAFKIQHPTMPTIPFLYPPANPRAGGGDIMEALCSEVLSNHGVQHMELGPDNWPIWSSKSHLSLNSGRMNSLKLYGDILIPAAPHNILISVKSEAARERFVVSGNRLESVGFGFFNDPSEFWTVNRINLLKRWGFIAIYMPDDILQTLNQELHTKNRTNFAININGLPLYRPLNEFGPDMLRVAGEISCAL
ncbi:hypothetical protein DSOUD_0531 [Desulfuromonas soudanensis]|uniref:Uncharacterized protein n=1 Tax=Desulfuromonas soudanensis TaxID=1603606 RepID=A0A0M4DFM4_9BACT|nr:hypothetical protein [Desulfuromonas soudanensis]ALC15320.1 hypothetical protein DSOUD_0531 [Desulfuromonas soudanensis]